MQVLQILERVTDPEIPVLTISDLGVLRGVEIVGDDIEVTITPTYSGCPAMKEIEWGIKTELLAAGFPKVNVITKLSPAWTTAWLTEAGKLKLKEYGIAPPDQDTEDKMSIMGSRKSIQCPQCQSNNTELISQFGSTACKSLYRCLDCLEPFDYFKCH